MRSCSLAYLTAHTLTPPQSVDLAAELGYTHVGLRLLPSMPGGGFQPLMDDAVLLRETIARQRDTGIGVLDLEVIRIGTEFDAGAYSRMLETGAALQARAVLVIGEDPDEARLAASLAALCAKVAPYGMTVDLEFLPWNTVPHARAALRVLQRAGNPANAGVLVDALHVARSDTTLADLAAVPPHQLHYGQICDAPAGDPYTVEELIHTARQERLLPGEGQIELAGIFGTLPDDLPVSVEVPHFARMAQLGIREWARQALAASRAALPT